MRCGTHDTSQQLRIIFHRMLVEFKDNILGQKSALVCGTVFSDARDEDA